MFCSFSYKNWIRTIYRLYSMFLSILCQDFAHFLLIVVIFIVRYIHFSKNLNTTFDNFYIQLLFIQVLPATHSLQALQMLQ